MPWGCAVPSPLELKLLRHGHLLYSGLYGSCALSSILAKVLHPTPHTAAPAAADDAEDVENFHFDSWELSYTVQNVIHSPDDADIDEFYWDLVPSERPQPINSASAQIDLSPEFAEAFNSEASCYAGTEGSSEPCEIDTGIRTTAHSQSPP